MPILYFKNPVFKVGRNVTCRRGIVWDALPKDNVLVVDRDDPFESNGQPKVLYVVSIKTRVFRFSDLLDSDLVDEHEPQCRSVSGLLKVMKNIDADFDEREMITLVAFNLSTIDNK